MKRALLIALVLAVAPLMAQAATLTYKIDYQDTRAWTGTSFATQGNHLADLTSGLNPGGYNANWYNLFKISVQVTGLAAGEDLGLITSGLAAIDSTGAKSNANYGLSIGRPKSGQSAGTIGQTGWVINNPTVSWTTWDWDDNIGDYVTNNHSANWFNGGDSGDGGAVIYSGVLSTVDARNIVNKANVDAANQNQLGENGTWAFIGTIYVQWNGSQVSTLKVFADPDPGASWNTLINNQNGTGTARQPALQASDTVPAPFVFGVPEPATMALLAIGGVGALLRRRR